MSKRCPVDHDVRERITTLLDENLLVEAAAGTGKTTLLIRRILELVDKKNAALSRMVAITFTEKAAGELKIRLRGKLEERIRDNVDPEKYRDALRELDHMPVGTIHGFCAELIRQMPVEAGVDPSFSVADEEMEQDLRNEFWREWITEQLSKECEAVRPYLDQGIPLQSESDNEASLRDVFDYMTRNADALDQFHVKDSPEAAVLTEWLKNGVRDYNQKKMDAGYLGFQDLLVVARDVLRGHESARALLRGRYDYLLIDEFQDTDPLQTEIIFLLASIEGTADWGQAELHPGRLFLVGDPKQSIYRFRRADLKLYGKVKQRFSEIGRVETISVNFRSQAAILNEVNAVFQPAMTGKADGGFEPKYTPMSAYREEQGEPEVQLLVPPTGFHEQKHGSDVAAKLEAAAISEHILKWLDEKKFKPSEIAILFRSTTHLETLMAELRAREIPFETSNARSFTKRSEVQALRLVLGALDNPANETEVVGALRSPFFSCSDDDILLHKLNGGKFDYVQDRKASGVVLECFALLRKLFEEKRRLPVSQLILQILDETKVLPIFALKPQAETRLQNLYRLVSAARRMEKQTGASLFRFVRWMDSLESLRGQSEADVAEAESEAVHLATFHKAKGLEFPAVFLYRTFQQDTFRDTIFHDRDTGELNFKLKTSETKKFKQVREQEKDRSKEEIARMLYVAMTRAEDVLVLPVHWQTRSSFVRELLSARYPMAEGRVVSPNPNTVQIVSTTEYNLRKSRREKLRFESADFEKESNKDSAMRRANWQEKLAEKSKELDHSLQFSSASAQKTQKSEAQFDIEPFVNRSAVMFGSLVHRLMETVSLPDGNNLEELLEKLPRRDLLDEDSIREAGELIRNALDSTFLSEQLRGEPDIYRELPYTAELDGVIYEGFMDLVLVKDKRALIVDYKTDRMKNGSLADTAEIYRGQARVYSKALQKILNGEPPDVAMFFLRAGEVHLFEGQQF